MSKAIIQTTMCKVWKIFGTINFTMMWDNIFLIAFSCVMDRDKVLQDYPWVFDRFLYSFKTFESLQSPQDVDFHLGLILASIA